MNTNEAPARSLIRQTEAARLNNISTGYLRRLERQGLLKPVRPSRKITLYDPGEVTRALETLARGSAAIRPITGRTYL